MASERDGALFAQLADADASFIHQQHPLLTPTVEYQGIQLALPVDIGLMKLAAVNSRGTRRDFVDLYCLQEIHYRTLFVSYPASNHPEPVKG